MKKVITEQASFIEAKNVNDAYLTIIKELTKKDENNQYIHYKNGTNELSNAMITIKNPSNPLIIRTEKPKEYYQKNYDDILVKYGLAEQIWYFTADNQSKTIGKFAKMWNYISDDNEHANSAYGYIIFKKFGFNQLEKVINELKANKNSRRATIKINTPHTNGVDISTTKDEYCTMYLDFTIKNNKLNLFTAMRSNDIWFGFPSDVLFFINIQKIVAKELGLQLGEYTHLANSLHMYERDFEKIEKLIPFLEKEQFKNKDDNELLNFDIFNFLDNLSLFKPIFFAEKIDDVKQAKENMKNIAFDKQILK